MPDANKHNPRPFIKSSDSKLDRPLRCIICGCEIEYEKGMLLFVTNQTRPCCGEHKSHASHIVSVEPHSGYPWNGIHPETGETQYFDSSQWFEIVDRQPL